MGASNYGVDIRVETLNTIDLGDEQFEVITMFDYLEHTETSGADLDRVIELRKPGGTLMIQVPNQAGWQSKAMKENWLAVICNHLAYFTPETLAGAMENRNMTICHIGAGNFQNEWDIIRQRVLWLKNRLKKPSTKNEPPSVLTIQDRSESKKKNAIKILLHSLMIEQIDHVGGWFGHSNFLTILARKQ